MNNVWIKDYVDKAINKEVHVDGWGPGPFFTVRKIENGKAHLSKRYTKRVKYVVPVERCYFTRPTAKRIAING